MTDRTHDRIICLCLGGIAGAILTGLLMFLLG